ncbi:type I pullulanase [Flaviaesturariibacter amylovorans]|uniref:Type I pullulanase n=1 Tax=Flaviaesturariibacter amylovorans TaxID=1084520 RepID=A0ABP8HBA4_9BACT
MDLIHRLFPVAAAALLCSSAGAQAPDYSSYPVYNGTDLGLRWSPQRAQFRIWAPTAAAARVLLYREGAGGTALRTVAMKKDAGGTWAATVPGNLEGRYYAFQVQHNGKWSEEVTDPYATAVGVNGRRGQVIDFRKTNPAGWTADKAPVTRNPTDAVLYELHVRDASIHASSGASHRGKFLGLTESGTRNAGGAATGIDHLAELGVTHVHLLPSFDYNSVDESRPDKVQYNWGYDPLNYNALEGSYATRADDGAVRIREFKQLVQSFHKKGLKVVMDVVYNHTAKSHNSNFNILVPGYYYRQKADGSFSDATACGNETASERPMMRKFMIESVLHWVKEYHVDGFRFDLMGVHDIETMNRIATELHKVKPDILLYGEGWTAGASPLPDAQRALKANGMQLQGVAVFSDDIRDGIKGSVFDHHDRGFASGKSGMEESIKFGIVASTQHPQVDYSKVNYSKKPYAASPAGTVTYCECHDNHALWDKLAISATDASEEDRARMQRLANTIVLTSQGIPFLHAGTEFLRGKKGVENSYNSPDSVNAIDWSLKTKNKFTFDYMRALIELRKAHPAFRMTSAADIAKHLKFESSAPGTVVYRINGAAVGDSWSTILVAFNGTAGPVAVPLGEGSWAVAFDHNGRYLKRDLRHTSVQVPAYSAVILSQGK